MKENKPDTRPRNKIKTVACHFAEWGHLNTERSNWPKATNDIIITVIVYLVCKVLSWKGTYKLSYFLRFFKNKQLFFHLEFLLSYNLHTVICTHPTFVVSIHFLNRSKPYSSEVHIPVSWGGLATSVLDFLLASLLLQPPADRAHFYLVPIKAKPISALGYSRKLHPR